VFKRAALFVALVLAAAGLAVLASSTAESASTRANASGMLVGFYDDESIFGRTDWAFRQLKSLRAGVVRITIDWSSVARRRPAASADPADPAYNWTAVDNVVTEARTNRIAVVAAIFGTPRWAGPGKNRIPRRITDLRLFAYAAAKRYSGTYRVRDGEDETAPARTIPAIKRWLAWNEPNNPVFLKPQWKMVARKWRPQSAYDYAKICGAVYAGVKSTRIPGELVSCGATGPRGNDAPRSSRPSTSPLVFMTWLRRAGLKNFDAWSHHPYYGSRLEKPSTVPKGKKAVTLANIKVMIQRLNQLWGRSKRIWVTEYGYQTRPPDRLFGVSYGTQAKYVHQSLALARKTRRIDMFIWFLIRDERRLSGWQSGVFTARGARKPSFRAFQTALR
jgi:Glycosyl hydrolase catalytic core